MYEKPLVTSHALTAFNVANTTEVRSIPRVPGKRYCRILDIHTLATTAAIVATTSAPVLNFGDGTTAAKFAAQRVCPATAGLAVGSSYNLRDYDGRVAAYATSGNGFIDWDTAGDGGAALTALVVTPVAGVGTGTGRYDANVLIEWW